MFISVQWKNSSAPETVNSEQISSFRLNRAGDATVIVMSNGRTLTVTTPSYAQLNGLLEHGVIIQ